MSRLLDQVDFVKDIHADKPKATPSVGWVHLPYHPTASTEITVCVSIQLITEFS